MSIKWKLNLLILVLGIISSIMLAGLGYYQARNRIFEEAFKKAELISSFSMASREYTVQTMRPLAMEIAGPASFHPELMGGFYVARAIGEKFAKNQPGYRFKQATINPVNPRNKANSQEFRIINDFKVNPGLKIKKGIMHKNGTNFFYVARPIVAKKNCLKCHGSRGKAPQGRVNKYPGPGGYNYKAGSVVAAFFNYVPIENALNDVKAAALQSALTGIIALLLLLAIVWAFISYFVTKPLISLTELADDMSRGKRLENELICASKDEIGALYNAVNRLRISVTKLIRFIRQKQA